MRKMFLFALVLIMTISGISFHASKQGGTAQQSGQQGVHWTTKVCSSPVNVTMQAGPNKDDNDVFVTWHPGDGPKSLNLPQRVQSLNKVYLKATTSRRGQVHMCVFYDRATKKKMDFDGGVEDHDISANDSEDDCGC